MMKEWLSNNQDKVINVIISIAIAAFVLAILVGIIAGVIALLVNCPIVLLYIVLGVIALIFIGWLAYHLYDLVTDLREDESK